MKIKKFALVIVAILLCFAVVSCKTGKNGDKEYKITYNLDGGQISSDAPTTYKNSQGVVLSVKPTKDGFDFKGWKIQGSNAIITKIDANYGKDVTLNAEWSQYQFAITYNLDGGTLSSTAPNKYNNKVDTTLPTPTKEGYRFAGWSNGTVNITTIAKGTKGDLTLTAQWKVSTGDEIRYINFVLDGGTLPAGAPEEFEVGVGLATLPTPTKDGYEFVGWFNMDDQKVNSISSEMEDDIQLTAKWASSEDKHNITYLLDGGKFEDGVQTPTAFFSTSNFDLATEVPTPVKEGWIFNGWELDGKVVTEIPTGTTEDVTLTATWTLPSQDVYYKITYICEGGTLPEDAKTEYKYGVGYILPTPTPTKADDQFLGWYNEANAKIDRITAQSAGDMVLTALFGVPGVYTPLWELNQIGFVGNGMNFALKVNPVADYDPNNPNYTGNNKDIKQEHQSKVEAAYDISIVWSNWEDSAPWGPERVKFINKQYLTDKFGDAYALSIASQWIPTLVKGGSIAELYDMNTDEGIFKGLGYEEDKQDEPGYIQDSTTNEATSVKGRVYGYAPGIARPDYFMYYNVDLVKECNIADPAEMWLKGEWTVSNFDTWVKTAQNALKSKNGYALDMGFAESVIGMVAAGGNQMTKVKPALINFTKRSVTDTIELLQGYNASGYYYGRGVQDVSPGFQSGTTILHHGDLWFMKSSDRFNPSQMTFKIGVVPYPTADGEGGIPVTSTDKEDGILLDSGEYLMYEGKYVTTVDMSDSSFSIPYTGTSCYAVLNVNGSQSRNGITPEIITHILHDLESAVGPDPNTKVNLTPDESYRAYLRTRFDREIDIEVIMSCQGKTYFELMELLSMTVGGGSHFGPNAWWPLAASLVKSSDAPATKLNEVLNVYKEAMRELGYNPA